MRETFTTTRLTLRRMVESDTARIVMQCGDIRVAQNLTHMPHPYSAQDAAQWLERQATMWAGDKDRVWGVELPGTGLIGTMGLHWQARMRLDGNEGWEMGYWLGHAHWGQGYATEAGLAVLAELDSALGPQEVTAGYALKNPNSGHVLEKIGFHKVAAIRDFEVLATGKMSPTQLMFRPVPTAKSALTLNSTSAPERRETP
jgi:[ribosomal protein S5]-alanine N-acetyltransferase